MKTKFTLLIMFVAFFVTPTNAQKFLKDLDTVGYSSSSPSQFINIRGSMYFQTNRKIWKSDGTAAGTVLLKDNVDNSVKLFNMNDTLYYVVVPPVTPQDIGRASLWKSDGTTAGTILLDSMITRPIFAQTGDAVPRNFTVLGNKLFFQMGNGSGYELWVTDGSVGGVHQVIDLNPSNNGGGYEYGGVYDAPMAAFNGKVYFQGNITGDGGPELYSSDGTAAGTGLVKDINPDNSPGSLGSKPSSWIVFNNELYFEVYSNNVNDGDLWKTDGTSAGTVLVSALGFRNPVVFKNAIYFGRGNDLWKTDGTTAGTVFVTDSTNKIRGANADYLIAFYTTPIAVSPYQVYHFKRIDGTISSAISTNVGYGASFVVLNNKMYNYGTGDGLWSSDGTEAGSSQLATNISTNFHVFNGNLYYNAWTRTAPTGGNGWGYELWWLTPGATTAISSLNNEPIFQVYPNPVNTELHFTNYEVQSEQTVMIFDVNGKMIRNEKVISNRLDVSELANGFYVFALNTNGKTQQQKFIVQH